MLTSADARGVSNCLHRSDMIQHMDIMLNYSVVVFTAISFKLSGTFSNKKKRKIFLLQYKTFILQSLKRKLGNERKTLFKEFTYKTNLLLWFTIICCVMYFTPRHALNTHTTHTARESRALNTRTTHTARKAHALNTRTTHTAGYT